MSPLAYVNREAVMAIVSALIYLAIVFGLALLLRRRLAALVDVVRARARLRAGRAPGGGFAGGPDALLAHLDRLLSVAMRRPLSPTAFLVLCIVLFFTCFICSAKSLPVGTSLVTGFAFAGLPYLTLRARLERLRRAGSYEGEKLLGAFLTNYLVTGGNIYETLERVVYACPHLKVTNALLRALLLTLRATGDPGRVREATERFSYGVGTGWAAMLAHVITSSALTGADMTAALEDILAQLREARVLAETRKRINGESVRMATYLTPALYVGSVFVSVCVMDLSPARFLHNQFFTGGGFAFFAVGLFLFLLNRVLLEVLTNRKLDF
ncbi:MAG: hypothetical protein LBR00_02275 [Clostridiales Family XIII bacterium]|jgi:hypothetical protein|nr:hypothetical protein [Clostridiales Family XIII bacterium]